MKIIFVDLDKRKKKEFKTYFERSGYAVSFYSFNEFKDLNSESIKNSNVVVISSDSIEDALKVFELSLSFARNVILLRKDYSHGWYRIFHKKGVFDFLKFADGMDEIADTIYISFKEINPFYKNKLLEREKSLLKVVKEVCLTLEFSQLLNLIIDTLMDFTKSDNAELFVNAESVGVKHIKRGNFKHEDFVADLTSSLLDDLNNFNKSLKEKIARKIYLVFPVSFKDAVNGFAILEVDEELFRNEMIFVCENFLKEVGPALKNSLNVEETKKLTTIDDLTTCFNRRFFDEYIKLVYEDSKKNNKKFSIIFMDLDNLKSVNTLYGHLVGSQILKVVAKKTIEAVRGIDKVSRFGGDEFCIILPDTDSKGARRVAERIKENISRTKSILKDHPDVRITASFGIATYPDHANSPEALIKVADGAMYMVKMGTKNDIYVPKVKENGD